MQVGAWHGLGLFFMLTGLVAREKNERSGVLDVHKLKIDCGRIT